MHPFPRQPTLLPFFTPDGWFQVAEPEDADLRLVRGSGVDRRHAHDVLTGWHLLAIHRLNRDTIDIVILGQSTSRARPWLSPPVVALDLERGSVGTSTGRRYRLGQRGIGEPRADLRDFLLREMDIEPAESAG